MKIELDYIQISNFEGIKDFTLDADCENWTLKGANGTGKTTVYDAFLWLLFGKNSEGKKDFDLRPLDKGNRPIGGLVVSVEAGIEIDGVQHIFKKENHEKVVKSQLRGFETLCWIDEVPKKVGEYNDYIAEVVAEDKFKLLTDLYYFNEDKKFGWTGRRKALLETIEEVNVLMTDGFKKLFKAMNGRTIDEYKKVLDGRKKLVVKERDEKGPRIDELYLGLDSFAGGDTAMVEGRRGTVRAEIAALNGQRTALLSQETQRQARIDALNKLESDLAEHERTLTSATLGTTALLAEKAEILTEVAEKKQAVNRATSNLSTHNEALENAQAKFNTRMVHLSETAAEWRTARESAVDGTCYVCKQDLPSDMLAGAEDKKKANLAEINERGNSVRARADEIKEKILTIQADIKASQAELSDVQTDLGLTESVAEERIAEINKAIKDRPAPDFGRDLTWLRISKNIDIATAEIGDPVSVRLEAIETERKSLAGDLEIINKTLAQADRIKQDTARIAELKSEEIKLSGQITGIDGELATIMEFKAAESAAIENAVNGRFQHVKFKLFDTLINGETESCCEAMLDGRPYPALSTGEKIFVGVDIINVLLVHYDMNVVLFIDNYESYTLPLEANSQVIMLVADRKVKKLTAEKKERKL